MSIKLHFSVGPLWNSYPVVNTTGQTTGRPPIDLCPTVPVLSRHLYGYQSTRHTRVSSQSQLVTSEHIRKPYQSQFFYLHAGQVAPINSAEHGRRNYGKQDIRNAMQFDLLIWV